MAKLYTSSNWYDF